MSMTTKKRLDYEIIAIKNEILNLKSWKQKLANQLKTIEYIVPIEFTLGLDINNKLTSTQTAYITVTPYEGFQGGILVGYGIDIDDLEKRVIWTANGINGTNGNYQFQFYINNTEHQGDTVGTKITYNVAITTTALVDIEVTYGDE